LILPLQVAPRVAAPCAVIVDLRGDGSGDYTNTWRFARALPHLARRGTRCVCVASHRIGRNREFVYATRTLRRRQCVHATSPV